MSVRRKSDEVPGRRGTETGRSGVAAVASALVVLIAPACGGSDEPRDQAGPAGTKTGRTANPAQPLEIELKTQNDSGQTGTATLTADSEGFRVVVEVTAPTKFPGPVQHAHIHDVTCRDYAKITGFDRQLATVVDELSDLTDGRSTTTVSTPLSERTTGTYSINVHEQNDPYTAVACGDVPKR